MRTIKASEVGSFLFCERAWWYHRQGVSSENEAEMAAGTQIHYQHGQGVMLAGCLRTLATIFLLGAIVLFVLHFVMQIV
jgi:hypothetical protein